MTKCKSCNIPYIDHLGLQGTCKLYQEALKRIEAIKTACRENLAYTCTCIDDYKIRGMTDPSCEYCNGSKYVIEVLETN